MQFASPVLVWVFSGYSGLPHNVKTRRLGKLETRCKCNCVCL